MKNIGVWIDKEKAHVVTIEKGNEMFNTIISEVENFHPAGGFGLGFRGSPQDALPEGKYLEREKHQLKSYFNNIVSEIKDADTIAIFGPAQTGKKFKKELNEHFKDVNSKVKEVKKVDSMTKNQVIELVRNYFK